MSHKLYKQNILKSSYYIKSDVSTQDISSSASIYISGSEVTYTPHESSKNIIYEYYFQYKNDPDNNNQFSAELHEDSGSGFASMGINYRINEVTYGTQFENYVCIKFVLPSYSGSRSYKLRATGRSHADECTLHVDEGGNTYYPIVLIYDVL